MCDGGITATMVSMGMNVAGQVASVAAQQQQAKAQRAAQQQASLREMERMQLSSRAERARQADEETSVALERQKASRQEAEAIGTTLTAAEEAGVSGTSVGLAVDEYARKNAEYQAALSLQQSMNERARRLGFESTGLAYANRMANINQPITGPNYLGAAIGIGSSLASGYQQIQTTKAQQDLMKQQGLYYTNQLELQRQSLKIGKQQLQNARASYAAAQGATQITQQQQRAQTLSLTNQP